MSFRYRVLLTVIVACAICTFGAISVANIQSHESGEKALRDKSGAILTRLEAARSYVANQDMLQGIINEVVYQYPDGNLPKEVKSKIMKAVPIVASMKIGSEMAEKDHYAFKVVSFDPRNEKNAPNAREAEFLRQFEGDASIKELTYKDEEANTFTVMRPIRLKESEGCFSCHGDPATSPWGNGKDILGYQMENWHDGMVHGMFSVTSDLDPLDEEIAAASMSMVGWGVGILLLCLTGAILFVNRPLTLFLNTIKDSVASLTSASQELLQSAGMISSTSNDLAQGATEQAASLEETAATLEEIGSLSEHNSQNSRMAEQLSTEVERAAEGGVSSMEEMTTSVNAIKSSSDEITAIMDTIDEIASQTNLLALNAAVEAARAGEAGKGFAVVAEEVRNLARRSAEAAKDTAEKIKRSTEHASHGVEVCAKVSKVLVEVKENSVKASKIVQEIAAASKEQATGLSQINTAVTQLDQVTQSNAASAEETAAAATELEGQVGTVNTSVGGLGNLIGNSNAEHDEYDHVPAVHAPHGRGRNGSTQSMSNGVSKTPQAAAPRPTSNGKGRKARKESNQGNGEGSPEAIIPLDDSDYGGF